MSVYILVYIFFFWGIIFFLFSPFFTLLAGVGLCVAVLLLWCVAVRFGFFFFFFFGLFFVFWLGLYCGLL